MMRTHLQLAETFLYEAAGLKNGWGERWLGVARFWTIALKWSCHGFGSCVVQFIV